MLADPRYPAPHPETWTPVIETAIWCVKPLRWRGTERQVPIVGRHGLDDNPKIPSSVEVRVLGGANGSVHEYDPMDARDFFCDLDFFIHYPHKDYLFDLSVIEAMAVGCPVLLPTECERTFGTAAVYCEPKYVWKAIQELWRDENAYLARTKAGRDFVLANCDWTQFARRLGKCDLP
jgi:hypothetical protein